MLVARKYAASSNAPAKDHRSTAVADGLLVPLDFIWVGPVYSTAQTRLLPSTPPASGRGPRLPPPADPPAPGSAPSRRVTLPLCRRGRACRGRTARECAIQ